MTARAADEARGALLGVPLLLLVSLGAICLTFRRTPAESFRTFSRRRRSQLPQLSPPIRVLEQVAVLATLPLDDTILDTIYTLSTISHMISD